MRSFHFSGLLAVCALPVIATFTVAQPASALVIDPIFTTNFTTQANAAAAEAAVNYSIGLVDSLIATGGTAPQNAIKIVFDAAAGSFLGTSNTQDYTATYSNYTSALSAVSAANPTNTVLSTAVANLAAGNTTSNTGSVYIPEADYALVFGANVSGCYTATGSVTINIHGACNGVAQGVVTLSTSYAFNFSTTTAVSGQYTAVNTILHEIDEILGIGGQGSVLNGIAAGNTALNGSLGVLDLYRYSAPGVASLSPSASKSYLSVNGGATNIIGFNQTAGADFADWSTNTNVQSARSNAGVAPGYSLSSPELTALQAIGYTAAAPVPEPGSVVLFGSALLGLVAVGRRRRA